MHSNTFALLHKYTHPSEYTYQSNFEKLHEVVTRLPYKERILYALTKPGSFLDHVQDPFGASADTGARTPMYHELANHEAIQYISKEKLPLLTDKNSPHEVETFLKEMRAKLQVAKFVQDEQEQILLKEKSLSPQEKLEHLAQAHNSIRALENTYERILEQQGHTEASVFLKKSLTPEDLASDTLELFSTAPEVQIKLLQLIETIIHSGNTTQRDIKTLLMIEDFFHKETTKASLVHEVHTFEWSPLVEPVKIVLYDTLIKKILKPRKHQELRSSGNPMGVNFANNLDVVHKEFQYSFGGNIFQQSLLKFIENKTIDKRAQDEFFESLHNFFAYLRQNLRLDEAHALPLLEQMVDYGEGLQDFQFNYQGKFLSELEDTCDPQTLESAIKKYSKEKDMWIKRIVK